MYGGLCGLYRMRHGEHVFTMAFETMCHAASDRAYLVFGRGITVTNLRTTSIAFLNQYLGRSRTTRSLPPKKNNPPNPAQAQRIPSYRRCRTQHMKAPFSYTSPHTQSSPTSTINALSPYCSRRLHERCDLLGAWKCFSMLTNSML